MKWFVYLYTYSPVSVRKVAVVRAADALEALKLAHQHPRVKSREADGLEIRRSDRPLDIAEFVAVEEDKQKGVGRAWRPGFKVGRPRGSTRKSNDDHGSMSESSEDELGKSARADALTDFWFE